MSGIRLWVGGALLCVCAAGWAQIQTMALQEAPAYNTTQRAAPPILPEHPLRPAIQAIASGGSGGLSYSGPSGAMNTSPEGATCAVTCALHPTREQYSIECPAGNTAFCQCDESPYASCRVQ